MNANVMKTQIFYSMKYDLKGHIKPLLCFGGGCVILKKTLRYLDLITTMTYVLNLIDNLCPYFLWNPQCTRRKDKNLEIKF